MKFKDVTIASPFIPCPMVTQLWGSEARRSISS